MNIAQHILVLAIRLYRLILSPAQKVIFGQMAGCRYTPTCSQYALEAIQMHGAFKGIFLACKRLCRCHPWGGCGEDPVPKTFDFKLPGAKHFHFKFRHSHFKA